MNYNNIVRKNMAIYIGTRRVQILLQYLLNPYAD